MHLSMNDVTILFYTYIIFPMSTKLLDLLKNGTYRFSLVCLLICFDLVSVSHSVLFNSLRPPGLYSPRNSPG